MYDNTLIIETIEQLEKLIEDLLESTSAISDFNQLPATPDGMLRLNGIYMCFIVIGEEIKRIDKYSDKQLLSEYPSISWKGLMGMRDRMAHGYFQIDIEIVVDALKNEIPPLLELLKQMKNIYTVSAWNSEVNAVKKYSTFKDKRPAYNERLGRNGGSNSATNFLRN